MNGTLLWPAVVATPLLAYFSLYRWPETAPRWLWLCCLPALAAAVWPPPALDIPLWPGARWGADDMRRGFLAFSALVWLASTLYAGRDRPAVPYGKWFWLAWLLTLTGNLLIVISLDAAGLYVGYAVMSLSAYILIAHGGGKIPRRGGRIYLQLAIVSELLIFSGLIFRFGETGFALELLHWRRAPAAPLTALLLLAGFGIKLGVWPLHFWMPLAYPASRPVVCAVLSGTMMKTAILGLWTFLPAENPLAEWTHWLMAVAVISAFYAVVAGLPQKDSRKVLAYSSISQAGYLLAIVALAWQQPEHRSQWGILLLMWTVHHGLAKGALFLGAGLARAQRLQPAHWLILAIPALAMAGFPLTTGAVVKTALEEGLTGTPYTSFSALLLAGSLATGLLVLRALWRMYHSQPTGDADKFAAGGVAGWIILSLMVLVLPWCWPLMDQPFAASLKTGKILSSAGLVLLAVAIATIAVKFPISVSRRSFNRHPGMVVSRFIKALIDDPPLPTPSFSPDRLWWRDRERHWNRFWRRDAVSFTALTLGLLLLAVGIWWL
ncbi:MAG: sodium:proton antiporter [Porticoccaceae bacterium]|nr:sodium:proton antiporter [Porticoccaceae bacterium]